MPKYAALKTEIAKADYSGMTDEQIIAAVNAKTTPVANPISGQTVKQYMIRRGILGAASIYSDNTTNAAELRAACRAVVDSLLHDAFAEFDLGDTVAKSDIDGFCAALISAGCMTADQQTELYSMQNVPTSWFSINVGIPSVSQPDLDLARAA